MRAPGETHGGFTDARGEIVFPFVPPGRAFVVVRADGARPGVAAEDVLAATTDTLVVRMTPAGDHFTRK